jgi:hypothetical protein
VLLDLSVLLELLELELQELLDQPELPDHLVLQVEQIRKFNTTVLVFSLVTLILPGYSGRV